MKNIINIKKQKKETEYTVFDAIRDNKGKGLKASDLLNILKKISKKTSRYV